MKRVLALSSIAPKQTPISISAPERIARGLWEAFRRIVFNRSSSPERAARGSWEAFRRIVFNRFSSPERVARGSWDSKGHRPLAGVRGQRPLRCSSGQRPLRCSPGQRPRLFAQGLKRVLALLALFLIMGVVSAQAQATQSLLAGLDLDGLVAWSEEEETGLDLRTLLAQLISGEVQFDLATLGETVKSLVLREVTSALALLVALVAPMLIGAMLGNIGSPGGAARTAALVCVLAVSAQLVTLYERMAPIARDALSGMARLTDQLYPLLAALLAAAGKGAGSALFTPAAAVAGGVISGVISRWAVLLTGCAAALTIAGYLSDRMRLDGLTSLVKKSVTWGLGVLLTLFTAMLSMQGLLAKSYDGASIQTARFAASSLVPVVGGELADSLDALVTSAALVRSVLGVTGLLLLAAACAGPIVTLAMHALAVRLASALVEPLNTGPVQKMVEKFAGVISLLLAAVISGAMLTVVVIGAAIVVFGG